MHEVVEKNLEHKKAIELKDKQLCHIKFFLQGAKKSYHIVISENTENVENIKQRYQQYQEQQQQEYFDREREYFRKKQPKKYKKVVYEEESDSEPEEKSEYIHDETEEIEEPKKKQTHKKEKIISFSISTMQREIRDKVFLGNTVSPCNNAGWSSATDRTASNYSDVKEKILKN